MDTIRLTVAQAVVRFLAAQHSKRNGQRQRLIRGVWGIFGHGNVAGLGQALDELGDELDMPTYRPQNEQAMVHLAAAHAKHTRRLSTFACTASVGPGSTNMITGAAGATINRLPVLLLPSDYFANRIPDPVLQQLEHPIEHDASVNDAFRHVSRFFTRISRPEQLLSALPEAMRVLTDPAETGAVTVSLPEDVQAEAFDWPQRFFRERTWRVRRPAPEPDLVEDASDLIRAAERPLIVTGGGTLYSHAEARLKTLAEEFGIPVVESQAGKGALPWDHPMAAGPVGSNGGLAGNLLAHDADLVIAVGTRLGDFVTASRTAFARHDVRFVGLNVVPFDSAKLDGLPLVCDAAVGLTALAEQLRADGWLGTTVDYRAEVAELSALWDESVDDLRQVDDPSNLAQSAVIGMVNDAFGDATVICAAGSMPGDLLKLWRTTDPLAYHVEYGYSCMGYEIPAGLGVKLAEPDRDVVVMVGDGSYLMMNSEIVTAVAEGLTLTVVVVRNGGFQSIHGLQKACGGRSFNNELRFRDPATGRTDGPYVPVDFAGHARAMGAEAFTASTADELATALGRARAADGVTVIEVVTDPEKRVPGFDSWWDVPIAEVSGQGPVQRARQEYDRLTQHRRKG